MVRKCIIEGCTSREYQNKEKIHYYRLQRSDPDLYSDWNTAISALNNQDVSNHNKTAVICSKHFTNDCFLKGFTNKLTTEAIPSIFPRNTEAIPSILENKNMEDQPVTNLLPEANQEDLSNVPITSTATNKRIFLNTPIQETKIRYPGDIKGNLNNFTKSVLVKCVGILESDRKKKKIEIHNMKAKIFRQKRTITKLRVLLACFKEKNLINEDAEGVL